MPRGTQDFEREGCVPPDISRIELWRIVRLFAHLLAQLPFFGASFFLWRFFGSMAMNFIDLWQLLANIVTVFGLPLAIYTFVLEQRKERENEDEEVYQLLSDAYIDFLKLVLAHPDLKLRTQSATPNLTEEQQERMHVLFEILISLFERAYLTAYEDDMTPSQKRRWHSWDDFMREWCRREDFRTRLPLLLHGEDVDFARYIERIAEQEATIRATQS